MQFLNVEIAISKVGKYAVSESGDTAEVVERPRGGISAVIADGQRSGRPAKLISNLVVHKVTSLLAEGVRDGAAARAAHDYLQMYRQGKVSATLAIMSVDLMSKTIVLSRNSHCPFLVFSPEGDVMTMEEPSEVIGITPLVRPVVREISLEAGLYVLGFTDGILHAGRHYGEKLDLEEVLKESVSRSGSSQDVADFILEKAILLDRGRPDDDMTVAILHVEKQETESEVRKLQVSVPVRIFQTETDRGGKVK